MKSAKVNEVVLLVSLGTLPRCKTIKSRALRMIDQSPRLSRNFRKKNFELLKMIE